MISQTALETLEDLRAEGLSPSDADVIRLNALGLKLEARQKKNPLDSTEYLPRVAAISKTVSFRQPTIGHEIWLDKIERVILRGDYQTALAVKAFALSRPSAALPDPDDPKSVAAAVSAYAEELSEFTTNQIHAAIDYAVFGADPKAGEFAARPEAEADGSVYEDWKYCVSVGVLNEARVALFGVSQAEIEAMTRRQVCDLIERSFFYHQIEVDPQISQAQRDYYATVREIRERLEKEKVKNG